MNVLEQQQDGAWGAPRQIPAHLDSADLDAWRKARDAVVAECLALDLTRTKAAKRFDMPAPTFSMWLDGNYGGNWPQQTARIEKGLQQIRDQREQATTAIKAPGFIMTPTAREVADTLTYAQTAPEMVIITLGAGMGKTIAARHFAHTRANAFCVTMRPRTSSMHSMLAEIAVALGVLERNPAWLDRSIGEKLKRNGRQTLLMVDEAQNLGDQAINQLRYFLDEYECGIALLGNQEIFARFGKSDTREGFGQIHRRIGKRLHRLHPQAADIEAIIDAWRIIDPEQRKLLAVIGKKAGALGQIDKTLKLANIIASGANEALSADHIRSAWSNRAAEMLQ
jgi:DNA transposition AAA+ family ATPase